MWLEYETLQQPTTEPAWRSAFSGQKSCDRGQREIADNEKGRASQMQNANVDSMRGQRRKGLGRRGRLGLIGGPPQNRV